MDSKSFLMTPYIFILKVRMFYLPSSNRFNIARQKSVGEIVPPPSLNRVKTCTFFTRYQGEYFKLKDFGSALFNHTIRPHYKEPVKLIKPVKIAHSFLQFVSDQFHIIILSLPV